MGTTSDTGRGHVEDVLEHYGIKGMRWGVRRKNPSGDSGPVKVTGKKGKGVVKVSGGGGKQVSEDAVTRYAVSQKGKKSTMASLSNEELKKHNERAKLEQEFAKYNAEQTQKGQSLVKKIMKNERESILLNGRPGPIVSTGLMLATALTIKAVSGGSGVEAIAKARGGAKLFEEAAKKSGTTKVVSDTAKTVAKAATVATATQAGQASVNTILKSPPPMPRSYASQLSIAPGSTSKLGLGNGPRSIGSMSLTALQLKYPK